MKKIKVFSMDFDVNRYQSITFDSFRRGRVPNLKFDGQKHLPTWKKPKMWMQYPKMDVPDLFHVSGVVDAFIVHPDTYPKLAEFLEMSAEILPVEYDGEVWPLINVIECPDCLDHDRSDVDDYRYVFNRRLVPEPPEQTLFKIPDDAGQYFVTEVRGDPDTEFKAACEKHKVKGIDFKLVWQG